MGCRRVRESLEELADQIDVERTDSGAGVAHPVEQPGTPGEIDDDPGQRLVERDVGVPVAGDSALVAEGPGNGLPEHDAGVLDGVVVIDRGVAVGANVQVDHTVPCHLLEHVLEEGDAGGKVRVPRCRRARR